MPLATVRDYKVAEEARSAGGKKRGGNRPGSKTKVRTGVQWMVSVEAIEKVRGFRDEFNPFWKWFRAGWVSQVTLLSREHRQA